jgi:hypothetical protein
MKLDPRPMRTICVFDLLDDVATARPYDTRTLDVPKNFDRHTAIASFDASSRVRCVSTDGQALIYAAFTTPLSSRAEGEECLVADRAFRATVAHPCNYRLSAALAADSGE